MKRGGGQDGMGNHPATRESHMFHVTHPPADELRSERDGRESHIDLGVRGGVISACQPGMLRGGGGGGKTPEEIYSAERKEGGGGVIIRFPPPLLPTPRARARA